MPDFRVYFKHDEGHFLMVRQLKNVGEVEALNTAKQWLDGNDLEVWEGDRQVAVLCKDQKL